ncbi:MAG TPA: GlsB/YeaQ/YmgE family stress response membrane protein [Thermoanaerobaculia bacterium]|nr:GlsB/YeaQ/YmgE family stress response membrane protein [Thermoanaerobaculia bacterium]
MYLIISLIACVIAGWLTGLLMKGKGYGLLVDLLLGLVGGFIGGWLVGHVFPIGGLIGQVLVRMLGAVVLVFLIRLIRRA